MKQYTRYTYIETICYSICGFLNIEIYNCDEYYSKKLYFKALGYFLSMIVIKVIDYMTHLCVTSLILASCFSDYNICMSEATAF